MYVHVQFIDVLYIYINIISYITVCTDNKSARNEIWPLGSSLHPYMCVCVCGGGGGVLCDVCVWGGVLCDVCVWGCIICDVCVGGCIM